MSEFQFARSDRVIVPAETAGAEGVQGVVTARTAFIGREPEYSLQWTACDAAGEDGLLIMRCAHHVPESALIKAQPPKMIRQTDADVLVAQAIFDAHREARAELDKMSVQISRLEKQAKARKRRSCR